MANMYPNSTRKLAYLLFSVSVQQQFVAFLDSMIRSIVSRVGFFANCFFEGLADLLKAYNSSWGVYSSFYASQSSEINYCDILFSRLLLIYYYKNKRRAIIQPAFYHRKQFQSQLTHLYPPLPSLPTETGLREWIFSNFLSFIQPETFPNLREIIVKHPLLNLNGKSINGRKWIIFCDYCLKFYILFNAGFQNIFSLFFTLVLRRLTDVHIF